MGATDHDVWTPQLEDEAGRTSQFLAALGIDLQWTDGNIENGFLHGCLISPGCRITIERHDATSIGDALHEAGHLAVTPSLFRHLVDNDADGVQDVMSKWLDDHPDALCSMPEDPIGRSIMQSGECEAIAWSHAAAVHLGIDPFERFIYESDFLIDPCEAARNIHGQLFANAHLGINGLSHAGFCTVKGFPTMKRWLAV